MEMPAWEVAYRRQLATEGRRGLRRASLVALPVAVAALAIAFAHGTWDSTSSVDARLASALLAVVVLTSWPVRFTILALSSARLRASSELAAWSTERRQLRWRAIDGQAVIPATPGEATQRLAGETGDEATSLREWTMLWRGDLAGAAAVLTAWEPGSPDMIARKELHAGVLRYLTRGEWDPEPARSAAGSVPDPQARAEALAWLDLEEMRRDAERGAVLFPALLRARRDLGRITHATHNRAEDPVGLRRTLVIVGGGIAVSLLMFIVLEQSASIFPFAVFVGLVAAAVLEAEWAAAVWKRGAPPQVLGPAGIQARPTREMVAVPADDVPLIAQFATERSQLLATEGRRTVAFIAFPLAVLSVPADLSVTVPWLYGWCILCCLFLPWSASRTRRTSRHRFEPAAEAACYAYDGERRQWQSIDGNPETPTSAQVALQRLGSVTGETATYWRIRALAQAGEIEAATQALKSWKPAAPGAEVSMARLGAWLHEWFLVGDPPDYGMILRSSDEISDPFERLDQLALLAMDEARLAARRGESALDLLAKRRPTLGMLVYQTLGRSENPNEVAAVSRRSDRLTRALGSAAAIVLLVIAFVLIH
jgi:hypothetical protein